MVLKRIVAMPAIRRTTEYKDASSTGPDHTGQAARDSTPPNVARQLGYRLVRSPVPWIPNAEALDGVFAPLTR